MTSLPPFVVILGMHRSGTSALAGVLNALGFHAGNTLLPANQFNERGYFEDLPLVQANARFLDALGRSWNDERSLPEHWLNFLRSSSDYQLLVDMLRVEFNLEKPCLLKDPRICRLLPLWKLIFSDLGVNPSYVLIVRDPQEVVQSLNKRDGLGVERGAALYTSHLLAAEQATRGLPRVVVQYDMLLQDWRNVVQSISTRLCLNFPAFDDAGVRAVESFLSPDLRHFSIQKLLLEDNEDQKLSCESKYRLSSVHIDVAVQLPADESMLTASALYRHLTGSMDVQALQSLDVINAEFDSYLASISGNRLKVASNADKLLCEDFQSSDLIYGLEERHLESVLYFARSSENYSEKQRIKRFLNFSGKHETLRFVLPKGIENIARLRWDITNWPALCEVFDAWVETPAGDRVWQWSSNTTLFDQLSNEMRLILALEPPLSCVWALSLGFDPHAQVILPQKVLSQIREGWVFVVVMTTHSLIKALPMLTDLLEQRTSVFEDLLAALQTRSSTPPPFSALPSQIPPIFDHLHDVTFLIQQILENRDKTIGEQRLQLRQMRDELIGAEAQLGLLKDVMLDGREEDRL